MSNHERIYNVSMVRIEPGWNVSVYIGSDLKKAREAYIAALSERLPLGNKFSRGRIELWVNGKFNSEEPA